MNIPTSRSSSSLISRLLTQFMGQARTPLYRNSYPLIVNQVSAACLGVIFWLLVARLFDPELVGRNVAILSMVQLLSAFSELSLTSAAQRFVPRAGKETVRLVISMYGATVLAAGIMGVIFFYLEHYIQPGLLPPDMTGEIWLILATMFWCVFRVQDGVLTGVRRAMWVLVDNLSFNVAKILLIVLMWLLADNLAGPHDSSVLISWFLPVPFCVLLINVMIFWRFLPAHAAQSEGRSTLPTTRTVVSSVAGDYVGSLIAESAVRVLPLIVVGLVGVTANAYFYQAWVVGSTLTLIPSSLASSFTVEASAALGKIAHYSRRILGYMALLVVPSAAVLFIAAPLVLSLFGPSYAQEATPLLRWLAAASVPGMFITWYLAYARVKTNSRSIMEKQGLLCVLAIGFSYWLLPIYGISGAGMGWFISQAAVALVAFVEVSPWLIARGIKEDEAQEIPINPLLRFADWRFLTDRPLPRRSVCYCDGLLAKSVAAVSKEVVNPADAGEGECDLAVAVNPTIATLRASFSALSEGGVCYTEWPAWRRGGSRGIRRALHSAGYSEVSLYWPYPAPNRARFWLPLPASRARCRYLVNWLPLADGPVKRLAGAIIQMLLPAVLGLGLVPQLSAVAYRGVGKRNDVFGLVQRQWTESHDDVAEGDLSFLVQTGGHQLQSKIICMVFDRTDVQPSWIVKMVRAPRFGLSLHVEAETLERLNRSNGHGEDRLVVPRALGCGELNGVTASVMSALSGDPFSRALHRESFGDLARRITDWQISLAKRSFSRTEGESSAAADRLVADLDSLVGPQLDAATVRETREVIADLGNVPTVCIHNDFTPWNLIVVPDGLGAIDWTDSHWDGLPLLDMVYSLSNIAFVLDKSWDAQRMLATYRQLLDASTPRGAIFHKELGRYAREVGLREHQIPILRLLTWVFHVRMEYRNQGVEHGADANSAGLSASSCVPLWETELRQMRRGCEA